MEVGVGVRVRVTRKAGREIRNAQWPNLELDKAMKSKKQNKPQKLWIWKTKVNVNHYERFSTPCWKFVIHASGLNAHTFHKAKVFACFARLNVLSSIPEWEMIKAWRTQCLLMSLFNLYYGFFFSLLWKALFGPSIKCIWSIFFLLFFIRFMCIYHAEKKEISWKMGKITFSCLLK